MLIPVLLACAIGLSVAFQPVTNASAVSTVGVAPIMVASNAIVFLISLGYAALSPGAANWRALTSLRPDLLLGGAIYGAIIVFAGLYVFPRLGAALALGIIVASQLAGAMVIDHFGLYGMPVRPFSIERALGVVLVLGGAWLLRPTA